jgi:hypothetical protein
LQNDGAVRWLVAFAVLAPGCFYVDPINERPSAEIVRVDTRPLVRGRQTEVAAMWSDPNGDAVTLAWTVTGCLADGVTCDTPIVTGTTADLSFMVPAVAGLAKVKVELEVTDSHGAVARPEQVLLLDVEDQPPTLAVQVQGRLWRGAYPVGLPITVLASPTDPDNDATTVTWDPPYAPGTDPQRSAWTGDPHALTRSFTPDVAGNWSIHATADDGLGGTGGASPLPPIVVDDDRPPCLGTTDPMLAAGTITLDQARRFAVLSVDDDLDVYPPASGLGVAGFRWSIASPETGGAWTPLGTELSNVVIDPAAYAPGDAIALRVEISDAVARTLPCDATQDTCSITGDTTCLERQTWHLEVR